MGLPEERGKDCGGAASDGVDVAPLRAVFCACCKGGSSLARTTELVAALIASPSAAAFFGLPAQIRREDGSREALERVFQAVAATCGRYVSWAEFIGSAVPTALLACVASRAAFAARAALAIAVDGAYGSAASSCPAAHANRRGSHVAAPSRSTGGVAPVEVHAASTGRRVHADSFVQAVANTFVPSKGSVEVASSPRPTLVAEQLATAAASAATVAAAITAGGAADQNTAQHGSEWCHVAAADGGAQGRTAEAQHNTAFEALSELTRALEANAAQRCLWTERLNEATQAAVSMAEGLCEGSQAQLLEMSVEEMPLTSRLSPKSPAQDSDFGLSERQLGVASKLHKSTELSTCAASIDTAAAWSSPALAPVADDADEVALLTAEVSGLLAGFEELQRRASRISQAECRPGSRTATAAARAHARWAQRSQDSFQGLLAVLESGRTLASQEHLQSLLAILEGGGLVGAPWMQSSLAPVDLSAGVRFSIHTALLAIGTKLRAALAALSMEGGAASPAACNRSAREPSAQTAWPSSARFHVS